MKIIPAHLKYFARLDQKQFLPRIEGKTVILKADWNVTIKDGQIQNPEKIDVAFQTLNHLLAHGANVIILSHFGRPKDKYEGKFSLRPVAEYVADIYPSAGVVFAGDAVDPVEGRLFATDEFVNSAVQAMANDLNDHASSRIMLMENVRLAKSEQLDPRSQAYQQFTDALLDLSDGLVVFDAAAVWDKSHASITGILERAGQNRIAWGFHAHQQITELTESFTGELPAPCVIHISGTKPEKIKAIGGFLDNESVTSILVSGNLANGFLEAKDVPVGEAAGIYDLKLIKKIIARDRFQSVVHLPTDFVIARPDGSDRQTITLASSGIPEGFRQFDIGSETAISYADILSQAALAMNSGTAGAFDLKVNPFEDGTRTIFQGFARAARKTILGGDGGIAAKKYLTAEQLRDIDINVGGGSILHFLAFQTCPVAEVFVNLAKAGKK
ncbi:MAG: phosphoglycerate kinase [Candidatus Margulisiibacteriota bacterium]